MIYAQEDAPALVCSLMKGCCEARFSVLVSVGPPELSSLHPASCHTPRLPSTTMDCQPSLSEMLHKWDPVVCIYLTKCLHMFRSMCMHAEVIGDPPPRHLHTFLLFSLFEAGSLAPLEVAK